MLEVIALGLEDVLAAEAGGADRVELCGTMDLDGLSPSLELIEEIKAQSSLPLRVMARFEGGFGSINPQELIDFVRELGELQVQGVVLGFLKADSQIDLALTQEIANTFPGEITFHRAVDHTVSYLESIQKIVNSLPQLTSILTAGAKTGVTDGLPNLLTAAENHAEIMLVGGGLKKEHLPVLRQAGITKFHIGSAARPNGDFNQPVDPQLVSEWKILTGN